MRASSTLMAAEGPIISYANHVTNNEKSSASERLLEKLFSGLYGMIACLDKDFNFIRVNAAYAEADGKTVEYFPGKNHFRLYPDAENEKIFRQVLETGRPYIAYAKPFRYAEAPERGTSYWDWTLAPTQNDAGEIDGLLLTLYDVTPRVTAEQALRDNRAALHALIDATTESVLMTGTDGEIQIINAIGAQRLGNSDPRQLLGINIYDLLPTPIKEARKKILDRIAKEGESCTFEDVRNGVHFSNSIYPVTGSEGRVERLAVFAKDVTEEHRLRATDNLLRDIDGHVLHADTLEQLMELVCQELVEHLEYDFVWIGKKESSGQVSVIARFGDMQGYGQALEKIGVRWDDTPEGHGPVGTAIRTGEIQRCHPRDSKFKPWREAAEQHKLAAIYSVPLTIKGEVYGTLSLYSQLEHIFDNPQETDRIHSVANRLRIASEASMDQQRLRLLGTALAAAGNGVFITKTDGKLVWVNQAFCRQSGYSEHQLIGETPRILKSGYQDNAYYAELWQTILAGKRWSSEVVERRRNGDLYTVSQTITPIFDNDGEISHFIAIHEDISKQKQAQERIEYLAHYDTLTGLTNRTLFYERLKHTIALAKRSERRFALMFLDLDRFKPINDTFGHGIGDLLLKEVAERLRECLRESDTVARLGGDEFTVILPEINANEEALTVASKLVQLIAQPYQLEEFEVTTSASIGIAFYPQHGTTDSELITAADSAMYDAKYSGRNRVSVAKTH